jgi:hypothetical protein
MQIAGVDEGMQDVSDVMYHRQQWADHRPLLYRNATIPVNYENLDANKEAVAMA